MKTAVKFFGQVAEITGCPSLQVEFVQDTDSLVEIIRQAYPRLREVSFTVALDRRVIATRAIIEPGSEVALLPPFSGG